MRGRGIYCNEAKFFLRELIFHAHHVCKKGHKHKDAHKCGLDWGVSKEVFR